MSTDLFTPRSHSMATRDFGSTFSCSSSEASSRLAARLERSEYKRSRAKQRMNGSSRSHSRRKDSRGNRKKNSVPSTRETRTKSEEDGVTSVWEVYRQNPYYYSDAIPQGSTEKREQRNTWYGVPSSSQPSQRRPQSIHIGSSDYGSLEYQSWLSRKEKQKNSYEQDINQDSLEQRTKAHKSDSKYGSCHSPTYRETQQCKDIKGDYSMDKQGMYLSRSLSSSFSSYVGSSDEKEHSQGIYSAYDVASRSPYEPMLGRRYSQSSLSSSNASWQQSAPALNYNMRDIPPLLDPLGLKSPQRLHSKNPKSSAHQREFREEFQIIKESLPPIVPPKPKKYSSSYTIQLHSSTLKELSHQGLATNKSDPIGTKGLDQTDGKGLSVREIAKKFTPSSVRHISSEYNTQEEERRQSWPKAISVSYQEGSPPFDHTETSPPRTLHIEDKALAVVMRQKEQSSKTPEELASHRLSLQELIQLHEEQIAIQAKSAKTILAHAYIKRSPTSATASLLSKADLEGKGIKSIVQSEIKTETLPDTCSYKVSNSTVQQERADYEVRDVVMSQSSPFKVIELTDKTADTLKGRASRLKRHRTIGIVGYRHQIDRTSGEKVQTKLKRHTTVGIVRDFTDSSEILTTPLKAPPKPPPKQEDQSLYPLRKMDVKNDNITRQEDNKKPIPVKIFDIESSSEEPQSLTLQAQETLQNEEFVAKVDEQVISAAAEFWYSGASPNKDFLEYHKEDKYLPAVDDSTRRKEDRTAVSSTTVEAQQDGDHLRLSNTGKYSSTLQDTPSRSSHSPMVELAPERNGNPAAFYKSATASHSYLKDASSSAKELQPKNIHNIGTTKTHSVPVAQVSPVSHSFRSPEVTEMKAMQMASPPPPEPLSAHEMYETRLAMWDLLPRQGRSTDDLSEHRSNEGQLSFHSKHSHHSKSPVKFVAPTLEDNTDIQASRYSLNFQRLNKTDDYYLGVIERLNTENQRLKEKNEAEKKEFRRMYEEQKKVANAYQKLEDRYRRRVHELQDALATCTCQGSIMVNESNLKSSHFNHQNEKESHTSKLQSSKSGIRMFEELEEWLSEQSKNSKAPQTNATSRDSLISSSSDLTGTGWDEHCDMLGGHIDEVNGTHV